MEVFDIFLTKKLPFRALSEDDGRLPAGRDAVRGHMAVQGQRADAGAYGGAQGVGKGGVGVAVGGEKAHVLHLDHEHGPGGKAGLYASDKLL